MFFGVFVESKFEGKKSGNEYVVILSFNLFGKHAFYTLLFQLCYCVLKQVWTAKSITSSKGKHKKEYLEALKSNSIETSIYFNKNRFHKHKRLG